MIYVVRPGDTLWSIAQRYGVTPQAILRANNLTSPNNIYVGQTLIIPDVNQPPYYPPTPGYPRGLEERVERLERQVEQIDRTVDRLVRRVRRLERQERREGL